MSEHRRHIALTVLPIAVLYVLEVSRLWPTIRGAQSFAVASPVGWAPLALCTVAVALALAAYSRGWNLLRVDRAGGAGPYRTVADRRVQKLAGGAAWGLAISHLALHWFMTARVGPVAVSQYELLRGFLSRAPVLLFYVLGLTALGFFLAQGFAAGARAHGLGRSSESSRWLEAGGTLASVMMLVFALNLLGHFATGRAYWLGSPAAAADAGAKHAESD